VAGVRTETMTLPSRTPWTRPVSVLTAGASVRPDALSNTSAMGNNERITN
jgi:hypothetical protein